jgi:TM2 domain-containing membrane protein YozV
MFCSQCGSSNEDSARFCLKCGAALTTDSPPSTQNQPNQDAAASVPPFDPRVRGGPIPPTQTGTKVYSSGKSPVVALLLSFFIPGVGQLYNGDTKKGGAMLGGLVLSIILIAAGIGIILGLGLWVWSMFDAYQVASGKYSHW